MFEEYFFGTSAHQPKERGKKAEDERDAQKAAAQDERDAEKASSDDTTPPPAAAATTTSTPACSYCNSTPIKLKRCKGCKSVWYCDAKCQVKHWKTHKRDCKSIKKTTTQEKKTKEKTEAQKEKQRKKNARKRLNRKKREEEARQAGQPKERGKKAEDERDAD